MYFSDECIIEMIERLIRADLLKGDNTHLHEDYLNVGQRAEINRYLKRVTQTEQEAKEILKGLTKEIKRNLAIEKTIQIYTSNKLSAEETIERIQYVINN